MPSSARPRLRIGLFVDSLVQPRWIGEAFAKIADSEFAEVVLLAECGAAPPPAPLLMRCYTRVDQLVFKVGRGQSPSRDLRDSLARARSLGKADWPAAAATAALDVAFAVGEFDDRCLDGVARYGVWRYWFGEDSGTREQLAAFWDVMEGTGVTSSGLIARLRPGAEVRLLHRSWSRTSPHSVARNREELLPRVAGFVDRALEQLHRQGPAWLDQVRAASPVDRRREAPGHLEMLRLISALGARIACRAVQKLLFADQWFLAFQFTTGDAVGNMRDFVKLMPPRDRFWADPFPIERDGRHFIFFEELMFATGKGHISMIEVGRDGRHSAPVRIIERDYHLSYPFLFEFEGQLYMIPETGQNRTVELYRCVAFPGEWRLEKVLLRNVQAVDATLLHSGGRWWMFANVGVEGTETSDDLHLFNAASPLGEWTPHRGNPLTSDVRRGRPAGAVYASGRELYRPAQIGAPLYGSGISINRIERLSAEEYVEHEVARIVPEQGGTLLGIHTLNRAGELTVVDGFTRRPRYWPGHARLETRVQQRTGPFPGLSS
jgi:hypothetical protein